jgi:hypothetical protein
LTNGDELPVIVPSSVDPDYECVLVDPDAATAPPETDEEGTTDTVPEPVTEPLCPPGYVPRLKPRPPYESEGKVVISPDPPEENPEPPPLPP